MEKKKVGFNLSLMRMHLKFYTRTHDIQNDFHAPHFFLQFFDFLGGVVCISKLSKMKFFMCGIRSIKNCCIFLSK